jgi:hypothetical protein
MGQLADIYARRAQRKAKEAELEVVKTALLMRIKAAKEQYDAKVLPEGDVLSVFPPDEKQKSEIWQLVAKEPGADVGTLIRVSHSMSASPDYAKLDAVLAAANIPAETMKAERSYTALHLVSVPDGTTDVDAFLRKALAELIEFHSSQENSSRDLKVEEAALALLNGSSLVEIAKRRETLTAEIKELSAAQDEYSERAKATVRSQMRAVSGNDGKTALYVFESDGHVHAVIADVKFKSFDGQLLAAARVQVPRSEPSPSFRLTKAEVGPAAELGQPKAKAKKEKAPADPAAPPRAPRKPRAAKPATSQDAPGGREGM